MKYLFLILLFPILLFGTITLDAQAFMGFENRTTTLAETSTSGQYIDLGGSTTAHELLDYAAGSVSVPVSSPTSPGVLGFRSFFTPSRTGAASSTEGLTEGDIFGYSKGNAAVSVGSPPIQGSQVFMTEDTDGEVRMVFDPVSLAGIANANFTMNFIVDGSFEGDATGNDRLYAGLIVTGCPQATTVALFDSDGGGISGGNGGNMDAALAGRGFGDDVWHQLSRDLSPYGNCNVQLTLVVDLNSTSEEVAFDNINFTAGTALPVEFADFNASAQEKSVDLNWATATEDGNRGFSVERSMNGRNFLPLGWVDGNGDTNERMEYGFTDDDVTPGQQYYYRLRQEDFDGAFAYSEVVTASIAGSADVLTGRVFPNPTIAGRTSLELFPEHDGSWEVSIIDASGRTLNTRKHNLTAGYNLLPINLGEHPEGTYFIRVSGKEGTLVKRLLR